MAHADLTSLAKTIISNGPSKIEPASRRVRALFDGIFIVDTTSAMHVWERNLSHVQFWLPLRDFKSGVVTKGPNLDDEAFAYQAIVKRNSEKSTDHVVVFEKGPLEGLVRLEFGAMGEQDFDSSEHELSFWFVENRYGIIIDGYIDAWFEEDQQIYDGVKNPYKRIDVLPSSRKVEVKIGGVTVADCSNPMFLFETGLRTRDYLPKTSVSSDPFSSKRTYDSLSQCEGDIYNSIGQDGIPYAKRHHNQMSIQRQSKLL